MSLQTDPEVPRWADKGRWGRFTRLLAGGLAAAAICHSADGAATGTEHQFLETVQPLLQRHCSECHADGARKGGIAFDDLKVEAASTNRDLWLKVLTNVRTGLMPPTTKPRLSSADQQSLERCIKYVAFGIDPNNPDPGRVTIRRLNRIEYRNTIQDLMGVEFKTEIEFPPDDTGYGFDDIGDVLTVSPMLLEKYLEAAKVIVAEAMPIAASTISERTLPRSPFGQKDAGQDPGNGVAAGDLPADERSVRSNNSGFFFTRPTPQNQVQRDAYARELLGGFARRAFRRPVDETTLSRLVALAEGSNDPWEVTFEAGIARALVAVLASPRFLFRLEETVSVTATAKEGNVDEYSLASRLSYFLWSTMPDDELLRLAGCGELRTQLPAQLRRMLGDRRSENVIRNFTGQWLQLRDLDGFSIDARAVLARDSGKEHQLGQRTSMAGGGRTPPPGGLDPELREAMRRETEMVFAYVVHEDRPVTELIESDYTFVNERLAEYYGLPKVVGGELRRVPLPATSPRGGVLTDASTLIVTSNPDRTSPVKRGRFILDSFLGAPTPPQPPNVPSLEEAEKTLQGQEPTLRETLQAHRGNPVCASCHDRMDPIGLAFENFNAMGRWREQERNQPIDPAGRLITGESFKNVRELKHLLATRHQLDFYRCFTEKLLTYALGRGLEYYDVETVDQIVQRLTREGGHFSALLSGVVDSAPFQRRRTTVKATLSASPGEGNGGVFAKRPLHHEPTS